MTQEEKAKAYDEALEKARQLCTYPTSKPFISDLQDLFPELAESEDERIRKSIIGFLITISSLKDGKTVSNEDFDSKAILEWVAWLEKQCEKGTNGNEREFPISEPLLTIKHAKEVMGIKQEDAWSEEDEVALCDALWCCKQAASIAKDENDMGNVWYAEHWLKSLKERCTWKPSDEQMEGIECTIKTLKYQLNAGDNRLDSLYADLKKLREK